MIKRSQILGVALATIAVSFCVWAPSLASAQSSARQDTVGQVHLVTTGRLIRSGKSRNGTPRFALLNDQGEISAYVVPTTGLSLGKHLNSQVAVTARKATRGSDGLTYLLAQAVVPMELAASPAVLAPSEPTPAEFNLPLDEPRILPVTEAAPLALADSVVDAGLADYVISDSRGGSLEQIFWDEPPPVGSTVPASAEEVVGEPIDGPYEEMPSLTDDVMMVPELGSEGAYPPAGSGCGRTGCNSCGSFNLCNSGCCPCGLPGRFWVRGEFLLWSPSGMDLPPLVTTASGNPSAATAGVLGQSGTQVLFGGDEVLTDTRNGGRFRIGKWCDPCQWRGFEVDYFFIENATETFARTSAGAPILARPFFNTQLNAEDAELVAFPGIVSGSINISARSDFDAFAPRFRFNLACRNGTPHPAMTCGACNGCGDSLCVPMAGSRVDFTVGYRYMRLDEGLSISEQLVTGSNTNTLTTFDLNDSFDTENSFHGAELGLLWECYRGPWSLEFASRFALGNNRRQVVINGSTISTAQGAAFTDVGGLLALSSNIGTYEDDQFVVIPELGVNLGYQIAPNMRFLVGYTFLYWSDVLRPGEQVDLNINPDLLPPAVATNGQNAPAFSFNDTSYWLQGLNLGLDWRW